MVGLFGDSSTVRDVGNAVVGILGHLPGCVVETVRLADPLDAVEVHWMSQSDVILPALLEEIAQMLELLLQDDEEQFTIFLHGKAPSHGEIGEGRDHDSLLLLFLSLALFC